MRRAQASTLTELLLAIVIIVMIAGTIAPSVSRALQRARVSVGWWSELHNDRLESLLFDPTNQRDVALQNLLSDYALTNDWPGPFQR